MVPKAMFDIEPFEIMEHQVDATANIRWNHSPLP
jgi:hypothetical protein